MRHASVWRRLRRRCYLDMPEALTGVFALPAALCTVAWMIHSDALRRVVFAFGALWVLVVAFTGAMAALGLVVMIWAGKLAAPMLRSTPWYLCVSLATIVALLLGRVDAAFYLTYGATGLCALWFDRVTVRATVAPLAASLALCGAFAAHAVWAVIPLLLVYHLRPWRASSLLDEIRRRPTRAEYLAKRREQCAAGGG